MYQQLEKYKPLMMFKTYINMNLFKIEVVQPSMLFYLNLKFDSFLLILE
jgi:hypothetical protein